MGESHTGLAQALSRRFRVAGMHCADCAARLERALESVDGVESAIADLDRDEVLVRLSGAVDEHALSEAVEYWGYTLSSPHDNPPRLSGDDDDVMPEPEPAAPEPEPAPEPAPAREPEPIIAPRDERLDDFGEGPPPEWTATKIFRLVVQVVIGLTVLSIVWVGLYRFLPAPFTLTMVSETVFEGRDIKHQWVPLEKISPNLIRSVIASEDYDFCQHQGFDFKEMQAAWEKAEDGGRLRGASTISQQTAKNAFLWPDRSWVRKAAEAYFTMLIETLWPKRRIMEVYLNIIEFGPGVFGAEAGARKWFGKRASQLSPLEAARLAAILPNPARYRANPAGPYINARGYTIAARARGVTSRCTR